MALSDIENLPHYVYVIHSKINDIVYYGMTYDPEGRWKGHLGSAKSCDDPLYAAMREHGANKFTFTLLSVHPNRRAAKESEDGYILRGRKAGNVYNRTHKPTLEPSQDQNDSDVVKKVSDRYRQITLPRYVSKYLQDMAKRLNQDVAQTIVDAVRAYERFEKNVAKETPFVSDLDWRYDQGEEWEWESPN